MKHGISRVRKALTKKLPRQPFLALAKWLIPALAAAVFWDSITQRLIPTALRGLALLAAMPVGLVGLVLVVAFLAIVILAFIDELPLVTTFRRWRVHKAGVNSPAAPARPEADDRLVQDIQVVWGRHGRDSAEVLATIYQDVVAELDRRYYWGRYLEPPGQDLRTAVAALSAAIADPTQPLQAVRDRFDHMHAAYYTVMRRLSEIDKAGDNHLREYDRRLLGWHELSRLFRDKLEDLLQLPNHRSTLKVFLNFAEEPFRTFLRRAETPQPRPDLPTPTASPGVDVIVVQPGSDPEKGSGAA